MMKPVNLVVSTEMTATEANADEINFNYGRARPLHEPAADVQSVPSHTQRISFELLAGAHALFLLGNYLRRQKP
jgi:hypothetical protein